MNLKYYLRGLGLGIIVTALVMGIAAGGRKESLSDAEVRARAKELGMTEKTVLADQAEEQGGENDKDGKEKLKAAGDGTENVTKTEQKTGTEEKPSEAGQKAETEERPSEAEQKAQAEEKLSETEQKAGAEKKAAESEQKAGSTEKASESGPKTGEDTTKPDTVKPEQKTDEEKTAVNQQKDGQTQESMQAEKGSTAEPAVFTINRGDGSYTVSERLQSAGLVASAADFDQFLVQNGYDKKIVAGEHMIPTDADRELIAKIITGQE